MFANNNINNQHINDEEHVVNEINNDYQDHNNEERLFEKALRRKYIIYTVTLYLSFISVVNIFMFCSGYHSFN